jgi:signal transduction histidine kinase
LDQSTILIVSDDAAFAHSLKMRWQTEAQSPAFTLMGSDLCRDLDHDAFALAVVGDVHPDALPQVIRALDPANKPVVLICSNQNQAQIFRSTRCGASLLLQQEGWPDTAVTLACEIIRRLEAVSSLGRFEQANSVLERKAALGGYMLESRHAFNNALTSILGNAELLLLDSEVLPVGARGQIETMRNMASRIHEMLARFTSIEKELSAVAPMQAVNVKARGHASGAIQ